MNKNNDIPNNDDLNGNTPLFDKMSDKNPFKTNNAYFENFVNKIQGRVDEYEELKTEAPLLSNIPKYNPFEVPADYFEELPALVQERCIEGSKKTSSIIEWLQLIIKPNFAIPFIVVGFIAFSGIKFLNKPTTIISTAEELSVEEQLYNIDEDLIVETLTENNGVTTTSNNIEDYLIENNIDELTFLINEQ